MADFVEGTDVGFSQQLKDSATGLNTHGALLGFTVAEIDEAKDDSKLFDYVMDRLSENVAYSKDLTDFKNLARKGDGTVLLPAAIPQPAAFPLPLPTAVAAGIEGRFRKRAAKAKADKNYTVGIGQACRFEATHGTFNPNSGSPTLKVDLTHAGHPHIQFNKGQWQGAEIHKMVISNGGGNPPVPNPQDPSFKKLERVFGHDYIDPTELPANGATELWAYKVIHLYANEQVGEWSLVKFITVGGM